MYPYYPCKFKSEYALSLAYKRCTSNIQRGNNRAKWSTNFIFTVIEAKYKIIPLSSPVAANREALLVAVIIKKMEEIKT